MYGVGNKGLLVAEVLLLEKHRVRRWVRGVANIGYFCPQSCLDCSSSELFYFIATEPAFFFVKLLSLTLSVVESTGLFALIFISVQVQPQ